MLLSLEQEGGPVSLKGACVEVWPGNGHHHQSWLFPPSESGFAELLTLAGLLRV